MSALHDQSEKNEIQVENKNKIIYRSIIDKSKKLDEIYQQSDSFYRIFQGETTILRDKLQKYCETLIFREPIQYAKKAEEILWRKGFYEIIRIIKLNKKNLKINSEIESKYRLHLASAYGFYNHLILRFQSEFHSVLQLDGFLNFPLMSYEKALSQDKIEKKELLREVAIRILHKLLICMGDLTRYHLEYDPNNSNKKDSKYYLMSLMLLPSNGMPLNQLGTLFSSENYGCDAAYFYLYSLCCTEPFYGARENLKLLFLKNRKRYDEIKTKNFIDRSRLNEYEPDELRNKEIKKFLVLFLYIIDLILSQTSIITSNSNQIDNQQLQELCQFSLQQFNSCMFYLKNSDPRKPYICDHLVFKLLLLILMSIEQLKAKKQAQNKCQSDVYFTVVAYGLIFFSYILNHCIIRFEQSILLSKSKQILNLSEEESLEKSESRDTGDEKPAEIKSSKKKSHLLYGHRRAKHYSDSDTNESEMNRTWDSEGESSEEGGQRSRRPGPRRRTNVARFIERENLSETELNPYNSESSDYSSSSDDSSSESSENELPKSSKQNVPIQQKLPSPPPRPVFSNPVIDNDELLNENYLNKSNLSSNFKELSLQLFSDFGSLPAYSPSSSSFNYKLNSDEFVDNEIYKFILNVSVPPGFEVNVKEVEEIEELGKKIASFEIETDTEMSVLNSDKSDIDEDDEEKKSDLEHAKLIAEILSHQKLLSSVKVFSDWLLCNKKIIQSISKFQDFSFNWGCEVHFNSIVSIQKKLNNFFTLWNNLVLNAK
ncbi:SMG5-like [Brachionus plicatilis]|uniref:SMG5-like n=1 Tax=Brachionus plicatilis TaxID=10195 RepID=A0A3M7T8Z0_BRAPC|nr:SMG5-like [Brachionus plicatilis]